MRGIAFLGIAMAGQVKSYKSLCTYGKIKPPSDIGTAGEFPTLFRLVQQSKPGSTFAKLKHSHRTDLKVSCTTPKAEYRIKPEYLKCGEVLSLQSDVHAKIVPEFRFRFSDEQLPKLSLVSLVELTKGERTFEDGLVSRV
jgi:hypothetical protein